MFHFLVADVAYPQIPSGSDSLLVGMLIVIAALLLVSICIQLITLSSHRSSRGKPASGTASVMAASAAAAFPAPVQTDFSYESDGQLVAVITAAIAATLASDPSSAVAGATASGLPAGFPCPPHPPHLMRVVDVLPVYRSNSARLSDSSGSLVI